MKESITEVKLSDVNAMMSCELKADGSMWYGNAQTGTWNSNVGATTTNCYDWWNHYYYPYYYTHAIYEDKGKKAIEIVKALMETKTIKVNTIKQFVDLLDRIMKVL